MHIVQVVSPEVPSGDGICSHVLWLSRHLVKKGHRVTILTRQRGRCKEPSYCIDGIEVQTVPFFPVFPFHVYVHRIFMKKAVKNLLPTTDLVHYHSPLVPPVPHICPMVATFHTTMEVDTRHAELVNWRSWVMKIMGRTTSRWIEKALLRVSDRVLCVSQFGAKELRDVYGYRGEVDHIPNIVNTSFYCPSEIGKCDEKNFLYVGRLAYRKGLFEIIDAAEKVVSIYPNVQFHFVGSGPLEKALKQRVAQLGIAANVVFHGEVLSREEVLSFYHRAYAILIPSHYEGMPMVLLEAMSCGKAIISTCADFSKGILEDGRNSILVAPKSAQELSSAIKRLINDDELTNRLGFQARSDVVNNFCEDAIVERFFNVYNNAQVKFQENARKKVIYNGIDHTALNEELEPAVQLPDSSFNIGIIGRLSTVKGHSYLIEAIRKIYKECRIKLYIFGSGELEHVLKKQVRILGIENVVEFMGFCDNIYAYLKQLDLFVMPSLHEGLPFALLYAMHFQIPIVASEVGGIAEALSNGEDAILIPPKNSNALADAIKQVFVDTRGAKSRSERAVQKVASIFSVQAMAKKYTQEYHSLIR